MNAQAHKFAAFDYAAQAWIDGEPARLLTIKQLAERLTLLEGSRADEFFRFSGGDYSGLTIAAARAEIRRFLAELQAAAPAKADPVGEAIRLLNVIEAEARTWAHGTPSADNARLRRIAELARDARGPLVTAHADAQL